MVPLLESARVENRTRARRRRRRSLLRIVHARGEEEKEEEEEEVFITIQNRTQGCEGRKGGGGTGGERCFRCVCWIRAEWSHAGKWGAEGRVRELQPGRCVRLAERVGYP